MKVPKSRVVIGIRVEFRISALQVLGNEGGSALGLRVPKSEKSDRWQESMSEIESV
jgi:hypothetical protein